ncbi:MAG TPA: hypothetical protein VGG57_02960 [Stellaceae bacterium]|jgi:hypothetical protein
MIAKAGVIAAIAVAAVVSGRSVDVRGLYDQMYPVSTLKRDVLNLCHENDQTFVRALREDRVACYSGMPHSIALALGFIHPSSALAELFTPFGGADSLLAAAGLAGQLTMSRDPPLAAGPAAPGNAPCRAAVAGLDKAPARSIDDEKALEMLADRRRGAARQGLMPTSVPGGVDSLTLLDDSAPVPGAPPTAGPPSVGCASRS